MECTDKRLKGHISVVCILSMQMRISSISLLCIPSKLKLNRHRTIAVILSNYNFTAIT